MKRVSSPLKRCPFRIHCFCRVLLWVVAALVLLSGESGIQLIGLSSLVMMEPIFYGSCALSETERCSLQNGRWKGHCDGPFIPSCQFQLLIWVFGFPWYQGEQNDFSVSRWAKCVSLMPSVSNTNHQLVNKTFNTVTLWLTFAVKRAKWIVWDRVVWKPMSVLVVFVVAMYICIGRCNSINAEDRCFICLRNLWCSLLLLLIFCLKTINTCADAFIFLVLSTTLNTRYFEGLKELIK